MKSFLVKIVSLVHDRTGRILGLNSAGHTKELIKQMLPNSDSPVVFDVGANIGDWTNSLLEIAKENRIKQLDLHCFEPVLSTYSVLSQRFDGIPYNAQIDFVQKACSSKDGVTQMLVAGEGAGTNSLYKDYLSQDGKLVEVEMITIDNYCLENNLDMIHFLKCDTEGHDMQVMHGAARMFREQRIMVFQFEYNYTWVFARHFLIDVFEFAKDLPYCIGKITTGGVHLYDVWHPELERFFDGNYLLIHHGAVSWFESIAGSFDVNNAYVFHHSPRKGTIDLSAF